MVPLVLAGAGAVLLNVYALTLVLLRVPLFGTPLFRPMVVNIGLSVLPAAVLALTIAALLAGLALAPSTVLVWATTAVGGAVWLLVLPNAAYLVTELNLSHRRRDDPTPLWYDIALVLAVALSGVVNVLVNVVLAQAIVALVTAPNATDPVAGAASWLFVTAVLLLVTFGVYLGRYVRVNSWDVWHPVALLRRVVVHLRSPGRGREVLGFCLTHTVLLAIVYLVVAAPVIGALSA